MQKKQPLISIIVPIYNAENYLFDCLNSILAQTYKNFEAILVNDGSTDNSENIAQHFCVGDPRFKLISQANSGVAAARDIALQSAKGEFVIHTDSDDLMIENSLELLYASIVKNNSNIAVGSYIKKSEKLEEMISHCGSDTGNFTHNILTGKYHASLWNKLISKELLDDLNFEKGINYMEDKLFLLKVLNKSVAKVSIIKDVVYVYRFVSTSYTNNITESSLNSSIIVTNEICKLFSNKYSESFIAHLKNKNKVMVLLNSNLAQRSVFPESIRYIATDSNLPFKHKLVILLDLLHLNIAIRFYRKLALSKMSKRSL